ncbi:MAG: hypothetical protein R2722_07115 [Tessaracoccus sp.]
MPGRDVQQPSFSWMWSTGTVVVGPGGMRFLAMMDQVIPWDEWTGLIVPFLSHDRA